MLLFTTSISVPTVNSSIDDADGNVSIQGYSPVVTVADLNYTIGEEDFGKTIVLSNAGGPEVTINDVGTYPVGAEINIINYSDGVLSVAGGGGGTSVLGGPNITTKYGQGTLKKVAQGVYVFYGQVTA